MFHPITYPVRVVPMPGSRVAPWQLHDSHGQMVGAYFVKDDADLTQELLNEHGRKVEENARIYRECERIAWRHLDISLRGSS